MAYLTKRELEKIGFKLLGSGVKLSDKVSIYNPQNISIGDNTRIDDFCLLSAGDGGINIGKNVHIAAYCGFFGSGSICVSDYASVSSRVSVYSSSDDYSGNSMTNPTIPDKYRDVESEPIYLGKHVIIGSGCVLLPGAIIEECSAVGALSLVVGKNYPAFGLYCGNPASKVADRSSNVLEFEKKYLDSLVRESCES